MSNRAAKTGPHAYADAKNAAAAATTTPVVETTPDTIPAGDKDYAELENHFEPDAEPAADTTPADAEPAAADADTTPAPVVNPANNFMLTLFGNAINTDDLETVKAARDAAKTAEEAAKKAYDEARATYQKAYDEWKESVKAKNVTRAALAKAAAGMGFTVEQLKATFNIDLSPIAIIETVGNSIGATGGSKITSTGATDSRLDIYIDDKLYNDNVARLCSSHTYKCGGTAADGRMKTEEFYSWCGGYETFRAGFTKTLPNGKKIEVKRVELENTPTKETPTTEEAAAAAAADRLATDAGPTPTKTLPETDEAAADAAKDEAAAAKE